MSFGFCAAVRRTVNAAPQLARILEAKLMSVLLGIRSDEWGARFECRFEGRRRDAAEVGDAFADRSDDPAGAETGAELVQILDASRGSEAGPPGYRSYLH